VEEGVAHRVMRVPASGANSGGAARERLLRTVLVVLGNVVQLYSHVSIPQLQAVHAATHPAARLRSGARPKPLDAGEALHVPGAEDAAPG
jgi:hypothetical protein